ncbi:hypothetical protein OG594_09085 [Streptomyces sp. NBC_01214]|uniref:hypothetical protein n=1 Tax=Streptomyces sp. NBC_01214 TaxID=2903777 RepID=UPI002255DDFD|nr:hypothetical protein [Streptomyces sp. NBC_01214]MCX4801804.1 hypothetical protein [Streptomyces sp. NBC_01214]
MAIEPTDELIELQRAANQARERALAGPYSREAWRPWLEAASALQVAVTDYATASEKNRYEVEKAVKDAAREPVEA